MCTYQLLMNMVKYPVMVGPALIHSSEAQSNFVVFFKNAVTEAFPLAVHLRCVNH